MLADGADKPGVLAMYKHRVVEGFTTNPTLMRRAGGSDYEVFARDVLPLIADRSISFDGLAADYKL
jgi:transaldolase